MVCALPRLALAADADAQTGIPPTRLRLADGLPTTHILTKTVVAPFIAAVERESAGAISIQHFPAEQLGKSKDMLILTQTGVADIGYVIPSYTADRMPLTAVTELPGLFRSTCAGIAALQALTADGGLLDRAEFQPNHLHPLIVILMPAYQLMLSTTRPFNDIKDVAGLKLRTPGSGTDLTVRALGAVPIRMQPAELYQSMLRGTVEGALFPYQSGVSYGLANLIKTATIEQDFGTVALTFSMATDRWAALPAPVRSILTDAARKVSRDICLRLDTSEAAARDKFRAAGARIVTLSDADTAAFGAEFHKVQRDWAEKLDRRGKPGTEVLEAFVAAAEAYRPPAESQP